MNDTTLLDADFDPKVRTYWYVQGLIGHFLMIFGLVGLVTFPLWVVFGHYIVRRRFEHMKASLSARSIHMKMGVINQVEKTIPLEKIQDISLHNGPLLNAFGLASVQVETAGGNANGVADMSLAGLRNAKAFRDAVLTQRDQLSGPAPTSQEPDAQLALLTEIRDSLARLELVADKLHQQG